MFAALSEKPNAPRRQPLVPPAPRTGAASRGCCSPSWALALNYIGPQIEGTNTAFYRLRQASSDATQTSMKEQESDQEASETPRQLYPAQSIRPNLFGKGRPPDPPRPTVP